MECSNVAHANTCSGDWRVVELVGMDELDSDVRLGHAHRHTLLQQSLGQLWRGKLYRVHVEYIQSQYLLPYVLAVIMRHIHL